MVSDKSDDEENAELVSFPSPEEVYQLFSGMSYGDLMALAEDAITCLSRCETRDQAEEAVVKMSPFFLDCTYPRLDEETKKNLGLCLDEAEEKFGALAKVLFGEEPDDLEGEEESFSDDCSGDAGKARQVWDHFLTLPQAELTQLAEDGVLALDTCASKEEAEQQVTLLAPFFLEGVFSRLEQSVQEKVGQSIQHAEARFGAIGERLGWSPKDLKKFQDREALSNHALHFRDTGELPVDEGVAEYLAYVLCGVSEVDFNEVSEESQRMLVAFVQALEQVFGPVEGLAARYSADD